MRAVVIEREFDYFGEGGRESGHVRVFAPEPAEVDWQCEYQIQWPGYERTRRSFGVDPWQALQLAMYIVPFQILTTDAFKQGRIGLFGKPITSDEAICESFGSKMVEGPKQ